ncbi:MAG: maleylpyruvate isomerase family mycothiol-dependent enzyme, partial [Ornithinimicrobium sp.]
MTNSSTQPQEHTMSISTEGSTPTAQNYRAKAAAITTLIADVTDEQWAAASPCEGWSAADVLDHMITTQHDFLTGQGLAAPAEEVSPDRSKRWSRHTAYVAELLDDPRVSEHPYDGYFGPTTTGETIAHFYGWDMLAHRYDLGVALGRDPMLSASELAEIEAALPMFGEALRAPGICGPVVEVEPDAPHLV